jgi:hypothetical protein
LRAEVDALLAAFDSAEEVLVIKGKSSALSSETADAQAGFEAPTKESRLLEGPGR